MKSRENSRARQPLTILLLLSLLLTLQACSSGGGGSAPTYTVGGSVSGLGSSPVVLQNNGGDTLPISADGNYQFTTPLTEGAAYNVTIQTQPDGYSCTVANGSGVIAQQAITTISVTCAPITYTLGGSVSGLGSSPVVLQNNSAESLSLSQNGDYQFTTRLAEGTAYNITIQTQPDGQRCTLSNSSGTVAKENITTLDIQCAPTYTIGVTINGLQSSTLTLQNNSESYAISASGSFTFPTALTTGSPYNVTIHTQPSGYSCAFTSSNNSGTVANQNISHITLDCNAAPNGYYTGGGTVKADDNTTPLPLSDIQAMVSGNRIMLMSNTEHLLYDATITTISGVNYSAAVKIYKLGSVYTTATLSGTIVGGTIEGTFAGSKAGNGTFTLNAQLNSQQADLLRLVTVYDDDSAIGDVWKASVFGLGRPWGFAIDADGNFIYISSGSIGLIRGCSYYGSELVVIPSSPLYQANIVLEGCHNGPPYTVVVSGSYTGLAVQYSVDSSNDTVLMAFTGAEAGFFAVYKVVYN